MLYGTSDAEPQTDIIVAQLAQELYNSNLLLLLIQNLSRIDFEVRLLRKLGTGRIWNVAVPCLESRWNVMAHSAAWEGKWRGNWRMQWVASTLHTTSEHVVSSITTADARTSAASSWLNWRPRLFKWTRPFRAKGEMWFLCVCHHVSNAVYCTNVYFLPPPHNHIYLGTFANLWKATASSVLSVLPSVCTEHLGSYWTDFHELHLSRKFKID
jgi:hypothetical protein